MKQIFTLFLLFFLSFGNTFANNENNLSTIPTKFKTECYEFYGQLNNLEKNKTYKLNINKTENLVLTQSNFVLPYKFFGNKNDNNFHFFMNRKFDHNIIKDNNKNTFLAENTAYFDGVLKLDFSKKPLKKGSFNFIFNYNSKYYFPKYFITNNSKTFEVEKNNLENFDIETLEIKFETKNNNKIVENIKIYELNFTKKFETILVKSFFDKNIKIYSKNNCKGVNSGNIYFQNYNNFKIDKNTKQLDIFLEKNPNYNIYTKKDKDGDKIADELDNCISIYNPKQTDSDSDGIGDMCSDIDKDGILGHNDNCPYKYNPDQKDIDGDGIGDVCDKKDDRFMESNKWFFIGFLVFIVIIFGTAIYFMMRKLK